MNGPCKSLQNLSFFLKNIFGGHKSFLLGHWYPSPFWWATDTPVMDFWSHLLWVSKPVGSFICTWQRHTCYMFSDIHSLQNLSFFCKTFLEDTSPFCWATDTQVLFDGPLIPLLWTTGHISSGFQSQWAALFALGRGIHVTCFPIFTSGVTPASRLLKVSQFYGVLNKSWNKIAKEVSGLATAFVESAITKPIAGLDCFWTFFVTFLHRLG